MPDLTPAQTAQLDQGHAEASDIVEQLLAEHRRRIRTVGPEQATADLVVYLADSELGRGGAICLAAVAITRLAQEQP